MGNSHLILVEFFGVLLCFTRKLMADYTYCYKIGIERNAFESVSFNDKDACFLKIFILCVHH